MEKEKLTHALTLRLTPEQRAEMQRAANAKSLEFSAWIRMVALEAARKTQGGANDDA
jgi:uncharacterized protein (DUF1778 family)